MAISFFIGFLFSIIQHFNIIAIAENEVFAPVDGDDFVVRTAGGASGCDLKGVF